MATDSYPGGHARFTRAEPSPTTVCDVFGGDLKQGQRSHVTGHVEFRPAEYQVLVDGRRARLTVREFELLWALAQHEGSVVPRPRLYAMVWQAPMVYRDRSVDVIVRKIRAKLQGVSPDYQYVHTHFGVGYRFSIEPRASSSSMPAAGPATTPLA